MHRKSQVGTFLAILCSAAGLWSQAPRVVAIRAGGLFDSKSGRLLIKQVVLIEGERVTEVGPEDRVKIPSGAQVMDLSQATVLPGLIECHIHIFSGDLVQTTREYRTLMALDKVQRELRAGFTTLRAMQNNGNSYADVDVRNVIERGVFQGPRMQVATLGLSTAGYTIRGAPELSLPRNAMDVNSSWEALRAVREQIHHGADWIKIIGDNTNDYSFDPDGKLWCDPTFTFEEVKAIVDAAHRHGKRVACHTYGGESLQNCVQAGVDDVEHAIVLDENTANMMLQKGIYLGLTISNYFSAAFQTHDFKATGGKYSLAAAQEKSARLAISKGLKLVYGSGGHAHGVHDPSEFEHMVRYGMTPAQAIQSATTVAAEMLGWQGKIGSIEKGKYADIIAVSGNPLRDITELERVTFVMKGGEVVRNDSM